MSSEDEKTFQEKVNEIKDTDEIKREETILKANEKSSNAKIRFQEKRLERKKSRNEKKLQSYLKSAENSVDKALKDADIEIEKLSEEIALEMKNEEGPEDFIIYKANSILEEIYLRTQLKILMAKNDLITNLQDYYEDNLEVEEFEEEIADLKEKTDHLIGTLEGKIATEKEELKEKYGSE
jgi:hypothetical protein